MDDIKSLIKKSRIELDTAISEALKKFSKDDVIKALEAKRTDYGLLTMFSTTKGYGGAPNYERLQVCIQLLDEAIRKLKK